MNKNNDIRLVQISEIIDWTISNLGNARYHGASGGFSAKQIRLLKKMKVVIGSMPSLSVGSIDIPGPTNNFRYRYKAARLKAMNSDVVSDSIINQDFIALRKAITIYAAEHQMFGIPKLKVVPIKPRVVVAITRHDVARILNACRGHVWDEATSDWLRDVNGVRLIGDLDQQQGKAAERMVLISVYSGTKMRCLSRLRWMPTFDGSKSYVDLTTKIEGRTGYIVKLGEDVAPTNMAEIPVKMSRRLTAHMRRWSKMDNNKLGFVISRNIIDNDGFIRDDLLAKITANAGLGDTIGFQQLQDAATVWALRAGVRTPKGSAPFQSKPSVLRSAALMRGMNYRSFRQLFEVFHDSFQRGQVEALDNLAETVR